jgi:DNA-binding protein
MPPYDNFIKKRHITVIMPARKVISLSAMEKIMKGAGAYRVGDDAKETLRDVLEVLGEKISKEADELSRHAGRRTIKSDDVRMASRKISEQ